MVAGRVSVITPTYNCGRFIAETIDSVLAQSYTDWEMWVVDDCSTDHTREVVTAYAARDSRIQYVCLETNAGAAVARTKAMQLADGQYMAFLDSDDLWLPDKLERQLAFMKRQDCAFTCTAYEQMDEEGRSLGRVMKTIPKTSYNRLLLDCPVGNSTVMYDVSRMGKFEVPDIRKRNDDALWLQMLKKERYIFGMPDVLMRYRIRQNSISSNKWQLVQYHWKLYREIEHLNVFRSAFHVGWWGVLKVLRVK